jgi:hypothetical protein
MFYAESMRPAYPKDKENISTGYDKAHLEKGCTLVMLSLEKKDNCNAQNTQEKRRR